MSDRFVGHPVERGHMRIGASARNLEPVRTARLALGPDAETAVRAYIPEVCLARLDAGQADWLAELRTTTVLFASVRGLGSGRSDAVDLLQAVTMAAQRTFMRTVVAPIARPAFSA